MTAYDKNEPGDFANSDWLAMQYVLGELSEAEASKFEDQLLVDEDARERFVEAVQLVEAVESLRVPPVRRAELGGGQRAKILRYAGMTIATAVVIAVGFWASTDDFGELEVVRESAADFEEVESEQLVALWTETGSNLGMSTESEHVDEAVMETSTSLLPPDWMLAAVEQEMRSLPSSDDPFAADDNTIERN